MYLIVQNIEIFPYVSADEAQNAETLILECLRLSYSSLCVCVGACANDTIVYSFSHEFVSMLMYALHVFCNIQVKKWM